MENLLSPLVDGVLCFDVVLASDAVDVKLFFFEPGRGGLYWREIKINWLKDCTRHQHFSAVLCPILEYKRVSLLRNLWLGLKLSLG